MERTLAFVIKNPDELKNPIFCYTVMMEWMQEEGEDFTDYHEDIIDHKDNRVKILDWLLNKKYISKDKYDEVVSQKLRFVRELLFNYEEGIITHGECGCPAGKKAYQLVAEYISEHDDVRQRLFDTTCIKGEYNCVYDDDNGNILSACIYEEDLKINTMNKEEWLKLGWNADISFTDEYNYLKSMTIEEADYDIDDEKNYWDHTCGICMHPINKCDCAETNRR